MRADQVYSLQNEPSLTIPTIRGLPLPRAVASIRRHVGAISDIVSRVHYIRKIYAYLTKKGLVGPWVLYRVSDNQRIPEAADVIHHLRETDLNCYFTHSLSVTTERTHICAVVKEVGLQTNSPIGCLEIYCFCIWPSLRCLAALRPTDGFSAGQNEVLEHMLGDDAEDFECGMYEHLDLTHQAATNVAFDENGDASRENEEAS
ncbi:hypothetical protein HPB51_013472 [Rhipicephalus microplus]|uniref:Uncharacterized protein n=1 Tax=Rhipicephalus microplus TaxID=6941 RepID=A0A9J6DMD8_RHIMP|nr:hypothetical protein HPB51_013472 [Rhipicephalus microplus]